MKKSDFEFDLPEQLIAQEPPKERTHARLLNVLNKHSFENLFFYQLPSLLKKGDVLVLNNVAVIKARFFGHKKSGGAIEILLEKILNEKTAIAQIRASRAPKVGSEIIVHQTRIWVEKRTGANHSFFQLRLQNDNWWHFAEQFGKMPLPPYIAGEVQQSDEQNYQTIYAQTKGAMAAPTAGLHFDENLLNILLKKGIVICPITLFVGAGTYQPVRVENLSEHQMHTEDYIISDETAQTIALAKKENRRVVCVGTTSLRALESSFQQNGKVVAEKNSTDIFIYPGFQFHVADALITNFHLPASTLLMLVSAFAGFQTIQNAYQYAIEKKYQFFSYGDAMFLNRI